MNVAEERRKNLVTLAKVSFDFEYFYFKIKKQNYEYDNVIVNFQIISEMIIYFERNSPK